MLGKQPVLNSLLTEGVCKRVCNHKEINQESVGIFLLFFPPLEEEIFKMGEKWFWKYSIDGQRQVRHCLSLNSLTKIIAADGVLQRRTAARPLFYELLGLKGRQTLSLGHSNQNRFQQREQPGRPRRQRGNGASLGKQCIVIKLLFFVDAIFTNLGQYFFGKKIFYIQINLISRCGQSFTNLAQQMNVLYSAEQKGRPLGSQALGGGATASVRDGHRKHRRPSDFIRVINRA